MAPANFTGHISRLTKSALKHHNSVLEDVVDEKNEPVARVICYILFIYFIALSNIYQY